MLNNSRWKIQKGFVVLFALIALFTLSSTISWSKDLSCSFKLTILYMNDTHGHYSSEQLKDGVYIGGFAKAMTAMERVRKANESEGRMTLTFLAGDLFTGTAYSAVFKGSLGVKLMNVMGFSAMAVGNHEFDYGLQNLLRKLEPSMKFPLLSANISYGNGKPVFKPFVTKKIPNSKRKILILGLTTVKTPELTHPRNVKNLVFEDPVKVAREILEKNGKDKFVIALTHIGVDKDKKLAILCPGIDVIVGGHSHTSVLEPLKLDKTLVCQAGAYSRYLGRLDIDIKDGQIESYNGELIKLDENIPEDQQVATIIDDYKRKMSPFFTEVIGSTKINLDGSLSTVRSSSPSPLGVLVAYVMADSVGADAGLVNGGGIRDGLRIGPITNGDIYAVLPFQNLIKKIAIKGSDLVTVLGHSMELPSRSGGKLQTYGIKYETSDHRIIIKQIGQKKFDPDEYYSIAVSDFLYAGGDGYIEFASKAKNVSPDGLPLNQVFSDFIMKNKEITEERLRSLHIIKN